MDLGFKGKIALVTGAGSQIGFGKAIALLLAKEGCDAVAVSDINLDDAKKTAEAVKALGKKSVAIKADVTKKAEVQEMVAKTLAEYKKIDILCNVAGAILGTGPFEKQSDELWDKEVALNFKGVMLVTQSVIIGMLERKYGKIINISSGSIRAAFGVSVYSISKGAVEVFTRHLAKTVIGSGINVNCVAPGWSLTNFVKGDKEELKKRFLPGTPIGRGTTPEDIANAVAYFASDISGDVAGQVLDVTGGSTL
jgi:NAD(P)-dependent dehydrogenase (short-subunit alcohol dehydrogenase family)